jgi:F-type H+-transporting ATPase subunit alpha
MKLAYLQFLELEVFTRFGARVEATMEVAIRHGRVLREVLKQDRLAPLPVEFQMAWLVAFNDGCFDDVQTQDIPEMLSRLQSRLEQEPLTLESPRDQWSKAVREALGTQSR